MSSSLVVYYASAALAVQHQTTVDEEGALGVNTINTEVGTVDSGGTNGYNGVGWRVLDDITNTVFRPNVGDDFATTGISVTPYYVYPASVNISYYYSKNAADSGILADDAASANTLAGVSGNRTGYNILNYELGAVNPGNNATTGGMGAEWGVYDAGTNNTQGPYTDPTILDALSGLVGPFYAYPFSNPAYISYYETRSKLYAGVNIDDAIIVSSVEGNSLERIGFNSKNYTLGIAVSGVDGTAKGDASTNSTTRWDVYNSGGSRVYQRQIAIPLTYGDGTNRYYAFQSPAIISYYMNLAAADAGATATESKDAVSLGSNGRIGFTSLSTLGAVDSGAGGGVFGPPGVTGWIIAKTEDAIVGTILSDGTTVGSSSYNILADTYYYVCPNFAYISYYPSLAAAQAGRDAGDCGDTDNVQPSAPYSAQRIGYSTTSYTVSDPGATFGSSGGATMNNDTWSGFRYKPSDGTYESVGPFTGNNPEDITNGGTDLGPFYLYVNSSSPPTSQANISYYLTDLEAQQGSVNTDSNNIQDITGNTGSARIGFNTTNFTPGTVDVNKGNSGPLGTNFWRVIGSDGYVINNGQTGLPVEVSSSNDLYTEFPASSPFYLYPAPTPAAISYYLNYNDMDSGITALDHTDTSTLSGTSTKRIGYSLAQYTAGSVVLGGLAGPVGTTSWEVYSPTSPPERQGAYTSTGSDIPSPGNYYAFPTPAKISYYANQSDAQSGFGSQNQDGLSIVSIGGTSTLRTGYNSTSYTIGNQDQGLTGNTYLGWFVFNSAGNSFGGAIFGYNGTDLDPSFGTDTGEFYAFPVPIRAFISYYPTGTEAQLAASANSDGLDVSSAAGGGGSGRVGYNAIDYYVGIIGSPDSLVDPGITQSNQNGWDVYNTTTPLVPQLRGDKGTNLVDPFTYGASGPFFYLSPTPVVAYISYYATSAEAITAAQSQNDGEDTSSVAGANNSGRVGYNAVSYIIGNVGNPDTNINSGNAASNGSGWNIYSSPAGNLEGNSDDPNNPYLITDTRTPASGPFYYASPTPVVSTTPVISYYANYAYALAGQQAGSGAGDNSSTSPPEGISGNRIGYKLDETLGATPDNGTTGNSNGDPYWIVYDAAGQVVNGGLATGVSSLPVPGSYYAFPAPAAISYYLSAAGKGGGVLDQDNINTSAADGNQGGRLGFSLNYTVGVITSPNGLGSSGYEGTLSWTIYDSAGTILPSEAIKPLNDITLVPSTKEGQYYFAVPVPNGIVYYANETDADAGTNSIASSTSYTVETQGGTSIWKISTRSTPPIGNYNVEYNDGDGLDSGTFDEKNYAYYLYPAPTPPPPATQANISYYLTDIAALSGYNSTDYSNIATISTGSGRVGFNSANFLLGTVDSTPSGQSTGPPGTSSWYVYDDTGTLLSSAYSASDLSGLPNNSYFYVFPAATQANISYYASAADAAAGRTAGDNTSFSTGDVNGPSNLRIGFNSADFLIGVSDPGAGENGIDNNATGFTKSWYVILANGTTSGPVYLNTDLPTFVSSAYYFAYPIPTQISYYSNYTNANLGRIANDNATVATLQGASGQRIGYVISYSLGTLDSNSSTSTTGNNNTSPYWIVYDNTGAVVSSGDAMSPGLLNASGSYYAFPAPAFISYYLSVIDKNFGFNLNDHNDTTALGGYRYGFSLNYTVGDTSTGQGTAGYSGTLSWTIYNSTNTSIGSKNLNDTSLVPSTKDGRYFYAVFNPNGILYYANETDADAGTNSIASSTSYTVATQGSTSSWKISTVRSTGPDPSTTYDTGTTLDDGSGASPDPINYIYYLYPATAPATPSFISYYLNYADAVNGRVADNGAGDNSDTSTLGGLSGLRIGYALTYSLGSTDDGTNGNDNAPQGRYWIVYNNSGTAVSSGNALSSGLLTATGSYYAFPAPAAISYYLSVDDKDAGRAAGDRIDTFSAIASSRSGLRLGFSLNYIVGVITSPNDKGDSGYSGTAFWTIYDSTGTILPSAAIKPLNDTSLVPSTKQGQYYYAVVVPNGIVYYANQANADAGTSSIASSTSYTVATQGSTSSWKMSTRSTGPDPSTTYDTGTTLDDGISSGINYAYYLYPATTPTPAPCFLEGTTILCLVKGVQTYIPVEEIKTGTLVKTAMDGFKPVKVIGTRTIENPGTDERLKDRLYKCSTSKYPELKEDLYITGCHSILVDTLTDEQRADMLTKQESIYITGDKYRLLACSDERAEPWASEGAHQIWHFALDHEDEKKNYGVYANGGLLVETCCLKRMKEKSYMILA